MSPLPPAPPPPAAAAQPPDPAPTDGLSADDTALLARLRRSQTLEDAPAALLARVIGLFPAPAAPASAAPAPVTLAALGDALRRLLVALVSDTGFQPAPALGLRAGGALRQIVGQAEDHAIELSIHPAADGAQGWMLGGQILGPESGGHLSLQLDGPTPAWTATLSELGEFHLGPLPAGRWQLSLHLDGGLILSLPPIDVPG